MKLPNGERAIVTDEKLFEYLLNNQHETQPGHAELFQRLLGIGPDNAESLREALLRAAASEEVTPGTPSPYGTKYELRFQVIGLSGVYMILSVWMIENGRIEPRLVTAYIE